MTTIKPLTRWTGTDKTFKVLRVWTPEQEQDPWVHYMNEPTGEEYQCRLEAFEARFTRPID